MKMTGIQHQFDKTQSHKVSVVISCFKRTALLWTIIKKIASNNRNHKNFEIILVDSKSCTENETLPIKAKLKYPDLQISIHHTSNILSAKRNMGRSVSQYPWLIFLDDDCVPAADWLKNFRSTFSDLHYHAIICGEVHYDETAINTNRFLAWRQQCENKAYRRGKELDFRNIVVMNMGMHRDTYDFVGGFSELFIGYGMEDQEFGWRSNALGVRILRTTAVIQHQDSVTSFPNYCRKMYFNGRDGAKHLLTHFPQIHRAIKIYQLIDPQYPFRSKFGSQIASMFRTVLFPRSICLAMFQIYHQSQWAKRIWPPFLYRYLAKFFFIEGAKSRHIDVQSSDGWYGGFEL